MASPLQQPPTSFLSWFGWSVLVVQISPPKKKDDEQILNHVIDYVKKSLIDVLIYIF